MRGTGGYRKRTDPPAGFEPVRACARIADDKKAQDIVILDLRDFAYVTDYFLIATATNPRQMHAIGGAIHEEMLARGMQPLGIEGGTTSRWLLLDYGDFVVHLFAPEWRQLYDLELLWGDAPRVDWNA